MIAPQISDHKWNGRQAEEEWGGSLGRSPLNKWRTEQGLGRCCWKRIKDQVKKRESHHGPWGDVVRIEDSVGVCRRSKHRVDCCSLRRAVPQRDCGVRNDQNREWRDFPGTYRRTNNLDSYLLRITFGQSVLPVVRGELS